MNNRATLQWAFGGGPMGGAGMPSQRPMGNVSFAQTAAGSQQTNQLDLSEFPSLSNVQLHSQAQTMWGNGPTTRSNGGPIGRGQTATIASHLAQPQQSEEYTQANAARLISASQGFRDGAAMGGMNFAQQMQPTSIDEFPPLSREAVSQGRNHGFPVLGNSSGNVNSRNGPQAQNVAGQSQSTAQLTQMAQAQAQAGGISARTSNGLLNTLSANNIRVANASLTNGAPGLPSPAQRLQESRQSVLEESNNVGVSTEVKADSAIGASDQKSMAGDEPTVSLAESSSTVRDPLEGMAEDDKYGLKGLITLMDRYPDYHAMISGIDVNNLGLDLMSPSMISTQKYSLFDDNLPRPPTPKFRLPDCYSVTNTQSIDQVVHSFNDEALFHMFYSMPGDIRQHMAAVELHARNWRWHKRLQIWITKDDSMASQFVISLTEERGWYIIWDALAWRKDTKEILLVYSELESGPPAIVSRA